MVEIRIAEEKELCKKCDAAGLINSSQFRINRRSRLLAESLIDKEGLFNPTRAKAYLKKQPLPTYTTLDEFFLHQVKNVIEYFLSSPEANLRLRQLSFPLANPYVEELIRTSLLYPAEKKMEKRDITVSFLMAMFSSIRQGVGSCFATAPLIMIQRECPDRMLKDLYEVITRGSLRRIVEGKEYRVPLSIRTGPAELNRPLTAQSHLDPALTALFETEPVIPEGKTIRAFLHEKFGNRAKEKEELFKAHTQHPLLKSYEYAVASFSDFTIGLSRWNFITALGLNHDVPDGLGQLIYTVVEAKLEESNEKIRQYVHEINTLEDAMEAKHRFFKSSGSMDQMRRTKREIQTQNLQLHSLEIMHEEEVKRAEHLSKLFNYFLEQYEILIPIYFQEVYDPEMVQQTASIFEDSAAGFRLLSKHGRADPRVWTLVENDKQYIEMLVDFFQITEVALMTGCAWEEGKDEVRGIVDDIILRVQEEDFLKGCYTRISEMHAELLKEGGVKSPYSYPSGGSASHLLQTFLPLPDTPLQEEIEVTSVGDLFHNLVEYMKDVPYKIGSQFEKDVYSGMLMTNPIHAFVFQPGLPTFFAAWQDRYNTYSYIRDHFTDPSLDWIKQNPLPEGEDSYVFTMMNMNGYPGNIPFADTNWLSDFFTFFFHPTKEQFILARTDGQKIVPLQDWDWLFKEPHKWLLFPTIRDYY